MFISVFELFSIGIGPSSSHTVGPMRAARRFAASVVDDLRVEHIAVHLYGSLAATGKAHGTHRAVMLGLEGETPDGVVVEAIDTRCAAIGAAGRLRLLGRRGVAFSPESDIVLHRRESPAFHPNALEFVGLARNGEPIIGSTYYSIGGGFVVDGPRTGVARMPPAARPTGGHAGQESDRGESAVPYPFASGAELLSRCEEVSGTPADVVIANESSRRDPAEVRRYLVSVWAAMQECVRRGVSADGVLPGFLAVERRAPKLYRRLVAGCDPKEPSTGVAALDWLDCFALAVSEENAAGGRVVTAPTNGAAGIIPAVLHYYRDFVPGSSEDGVVTFLLTASAIGALCKENASISGAEVGCQGEVGSASSMAAAGLCAVLGGTAAQIENAAEIGIEHHLGMTCDPVGGFVQVPCIERNAVGAVKAVNAAQMALRGDGHHIVTLDAALETMRRTGADMKSKYKETSRGGLALSVPEC